MGLSRKSCTEEWLRVGNENLTLSNFSPEKVSLGAAPCLPPGGDISTRGPMAVWSAR